MDYFKSADGSIVKNKERYNQLYGRSKELESLISKVPVDDSERAKKKAELREKISNSEGAYFAYRNIAEDRDVPKSSDLKKISKKNYKKWHKK